MAYGFNVTRDQAKVALVDTGFTIDEAEKIVSEARAKGYAEREIFGQWVDISLNQDSETFWMNWYTKDENGVVN